MFSSLYKTIAKISEKNVDMEKIGYSSLGSHNAKNSLLFEKEENGDRIFIIHFYLKNHLEIKQIITLRDYLRSHTDEVKQYSEIKFHLFQKFSDGYRQYRKFEDEYMESLKNRAISWSKDNIAI